MGTGMELEKKGLAEDARCCCPLFLGPGTGACGIAFDQGLKNCTGGEPNRVGEKQNRLCPRAEEKPFPEACLAQAAASGPQLQLFPLLLPVPPMGPAVSFTRSPPIQSSSGRQPRLRPQCTLLFSLNACSQQTTVFLTLKDKAKQSCAGLQSSSLCICLFLKNENFIFLISNF